MGSINHDDYLQREILALCVQDKFFLSNVRNKISSDVFTSDSRKRIFNAIFDYCKEYFVPPDKVSFDIYCKKKEIDVISSDVSEVFQLRDATKLKLVSDVALDYLIKVSAKKVMMNAVNLIDSGDFDLLRKNLNDAISVDREEENSSGRILRDVRTRIKTRNAVRGTPISVGLGKRVDEELGGGYYRGTLNLLVGGGGVGKSMCLVNIGRAACLQGLNVVHFTLEMSYNEIAARYDSRFSKIDTALIFAEDDEVNLKLLTAMDEAQKSTSGEIWVVGYHTDTANCWTFRDKIERLKYQENFIPDVIIVDYGDIMRSEDGKETSDRVKYSNTFKALRRLAQETNTGLWSATQFNREGMKASKPNVTDISEDISKIFTCDIALLIAQTQDEELSNIMRVIGGKVRGYKKNWVVPVLADKSKAFIGDSEELSQDFSSALTNESLCLDEDSNSD